MDTVSKIRGECQLFPLLSLCSPTRVLQIQQAAVSESLMHIIIFASQSWDHLIRTWQKEESDLQSCGGRWGMCVCVCIYFWNSESCSRGWFDSNHGPWRSVGILLPCYPQEEMLYHRKQTKWDIKVITHTLQFNYLFCIITNDSCHGDEGGARGGSLSLLVMGPTFPLPCMIFGWMLILWISPCWVQDVFVSL